jgi:uncharacterized membrane protein
MKKSFSTGLVILLPLALSIWVVKYLFDLFTDPLYGLIEKLFLSYEAKHGIVALQHHETLINLFSRLTALVLTLLLILILGYLGRKFFLHSLMKATNKLIFKIPIVGALYRLTKDIAKAMLSSEEKTFKDVALVPFPSKDTHTIGLVTGNVPQKFKELIPSIDVSIFVPTAPHPISGYVLFCPRASLHSLPISVEETFKFLISCGVVHPPTLSTL